MRLSGFGMKEAGLPVGVFAPLLEVAFRVFGSLGFGGRRFSESDGVIVRGGPRFFAYISSARPDIKMMGRGKARYK